MEETLRLLYQLQRIDSNLDDVEELKGDLPKTVKELEQQISDLKIKLTEKQQNIDTAIAERNKADSDIKDFEEKLKKYKVQQYQVRNNKEYDAITKEIEFAEESIKSLTKKFEDFENHMSVVKNELEEIQKSFDELTAELSEKTTELTEISKETEEEELKYKHEKEKLLVRITKENYKKYETIRGARGKAVVPIRKDSCNGCGNRIPPQHVIEIRRNDKLYICQHCGRIVVSDELAKSVEV